MRRQLPRLFGLLILAPALSLSAAAQECANDGSPPGPYPPYLYGPEYSYGGRCAKGRKEATMSPVEAFGVHPPGPDPADLNRCFFHRWAETFKPYYAPLSPVASSIRWRPWCYFPLMPYYTPYYIGYCPHRLCNPEPPPYGSDGWGQGPMPKPESALAKPPLSYGVYTSILRDDTIFWNMGGNGLVPYGTPRPFHYGPPDLVDMIQVTRQQGGGNCAGAGGPGMVVADGATIPSPMLPANPPDGKKGTAGGYQQTEDAGSDGKTPDKLPDVDRPNRPE